jgi:hypothetical protein
LIFQRRSLALPGPEVCDERRLFCSSLGETSSGGNERKRVAGVIDFAAPKPSQYVGCEGAIECGKI